MEIKLRYRKVLTKTVTRTIERIKEQPNLGKIDMDGLAHTLIWMASSPLSLSVLTDPRHTLSLLSIFQSPFAHKVGMLDVTNNWNNGSLDIDDGNYRAKTPPA